MITLDNKTVNQQYYVKNGIVYKVLPTGTFDDSCPDKILGGESSSDTEQFPYIDVHKKSDEAGIETTRFYLDKLIFPGDYYKDDSFRRTISSGDTCRDNADYFNYFRDLCFEQISESIRAYYNLDYEYFNSNRSRLGIPIWMFDDSDFGIKSNETIDKERLKQITFNKKLFDECKQLAVENLIVNESKKIIEKYKFDKKIKEIIFE